MDEAKKLEGYAGSMTEATMSQDPAQPGMFVGEPVPFDPANLPMAKAALQNPTASAEFDGARAIAEIQAIISMMNVRLRELEETIAQNQTPAFDRYKTKLMEIIDRFHGGPNE